MKILVTGGLGFIGSHTVVELAKANFEIVIVDNLYNSKEDVLQKLEKITGRKLKLYKYDLCNKEKIEEIFKENQIDAVIHFAGYKAVGESVKEPLMYYSNNLISTLNLLEIMKKYNVKKFIFSSSATVYGQQKTSKYTEDMNRGETTSPYGTTKAMIEKILEDLYYSDNSWNITLLRALQNVQKGLNTYNLGAGKGVSVLELVTTFEKVNNIKVNYKIVDRRSGDLAEYYADSSKASRELGWKTEKTIEDICRDAWNYENSKA